MYFCIWRNNIHRPSLERHVRSVIHKFQRIRYRLSFCFITRWKCLSQSRAVWFMNKNKNMILESNFEKSPFRNHQYPPSLFFLPMCQKDMILMTVKLLQVHSLFSAKVQYLSNLKYMVIGMNCYIFIILVDPILHPSIYPPSSKSTNFISLPNKKICL